MSSEYPYSENSGPKAGNDGVIDRKSLVHTKCEGEPQWWRLGFAQPMHVAQLTKLHSTLESEFKVHVNPVERHLLRTLKSRVTELLVREACV